MSKVQSKFDVREQGRWSELKTTIKFVGYVLLTFFAWLIYGSLVRRAYNKSVKEGRPYYVDRMPSGENKE